jgi:hypothetical protein
MVELEHVARARVSAEEHIERLMCHPRLPLVAGLAAGRPAAYIWDCASAQMQELGVLGSEATPYDDDDPWISHTRRPTLAWHPERPELMFSGEDGVTQWTPDEIRPLTAVPRTTRYRTMAYSPDGRTLWASPSSTGDDAWSRSDALDLASGSLTATGPGWDTGVALHPAGGLAVTLESDQGATLVLFARIDQESTPAAMRVLNRALVLDVDDHHAPIFTRDGRHFAVRGNAYEHLVQIFEFPSLRRVLAVTLGDPSPGYPYPEEWLVQRRAWGWHNIAFAAHPDVLWIATPDGKLVELGISGESAVEHDVLDGARATALAATAAGELIVATADGELVLISVNDDATASDVAGCDASHEAVVAFLNATREIPAEGDTWEHVVTTDGSRTWTPEDLSEITAADDEDPTWLRLAAAINAASGRSTTR